MDESIRSDAKCNADDYEDNVAVADVLTIAWTYGRIGVTKNRSENVSTESMTASD